MKSLRKVERFLRKKMKIFDKKCISDELFIVDCRIFAKRKLRRLRKMHKANNDKNG